MELLKGEDFEDLFHAFERSAFHLELKDSYDTPEERGPFGLFLEGRLDEYAWHRSWLNLIREVTQQGKQIQRARLVTVPHVDYTRWGLEVARLNIEAGEDIRYLPRHLARGIDFPADDFWLFDDDRLVFTVFEPGGRFIGGVDVRYPVLVEQCRRVRDEVWAIAIPRGKYVHSEHTSR
ncbi:DUF6879 family protein [Sphaerisporangium corydalis]|uniref:DUF6879 family protein n=1 Tax=Sphaerisporangium corydalis TaxID=1441875 RepID=A0ABV9EBN8_9ACTN|nr:DUF6879 family protein [Sphaerisporangium corydalis]